MIDFDVQRELKGMIEAVAYMDMEDRVEFDLDEALMDLDHVDTFKDRGVMTNDAGLVLRMDNGQAFQLTIVPCR